MDKNNGNGLGFPWKPIAITVMLVSIVVFGIKATFPLTFNKVGRLSVTSKLSATSKVVLNPQPVRQFFLSDKCLTKIRHRVGILDKNSLNDDSLMNFFWCIIQNQLLLNLVKHLEKL